MEVEVAEEVNEVAVAEVVELDEAAAAAPECLE